MANQSVSEELFQAMDVLLSKRLSVLPYDQTLICTIESTENASKGEYVVSDTSSSFIAYSTNTDYLLGTRVYVTVPNGDMNNQKMIIGKCVSEDGAAFNYVPPLDDFVDITGNLIQDNITASLLANKDINLLSVEESNTLKDNYNELYKDITSIASREKVVWSWTAPIDTQPLRNYTRIGVGAKIKAALREFHVKTGNYGLRLDLQVETTSTSANGSSTKQYSFYFESKDFFGTPFAFDTYFQQEKLFDISDILINSDTIEGVTSSSVTAMRLVFYQEADFANVNGNKVPFMENESSLLPDNLFLKDPYISFGYALDDYPDGTVILGSNNGLTYSPKRPSSKKEIYLRWIHSQDNGSLTAIDTIEELKEAFPDGKVHWYKYTLEDNAADELAGAFWVELLTKQEAKAFINNRKWAEIEAALTQEYEAGYYTEDTYKTKVEQYRSLYNSLYKEDVTYLSAQNTFEHSFIPDTSQQFASFKVIIESKSKTTILNELENNVDLLNIYDLFKSRCDTSNLTFAASTEENEVTNYEKFWPKLQNIVHDGTEKGYSLLRDQCNKKGGLLYIGTNEVTTEPIFPGNAASQSKKDQYEKDLKAYKSYIERKENVEAFEQAASIVLAAYAENTLYKSNVLKFENEVLCANAADIDLIQGLTILCDSKEEGGYGGVYYIYGSNNAILNGAEAAKKRSLVATYSSLVTGETALDKASQISWWIPLNNTMIETPTKDYEYTLDTAYDRKYNAWQRTLTDSSKTAAEQDAAKVAVIQALDNFKLTEPDFRYDEDTLKPASQASRDLLNQYIDSYKEENGYAIITRKGSENYTDAAEAVGESQQIDTVQTFRIKNYYEQYATNNTIYCKIIKNNREYIASITLSFGTAGTNGTDATFKLELTDKITQFVDEETADTYISVPCMDYFTKGVLGSEYYVFPHLYDYNNQQVDLKDREIQYSWFSGVYLNSTTVDELTKGLEKATNRKRELQVKYNSSSESERLEQMYKLVDTDKTEDLEIYVLKDGSVVAATFPEATLEYYYLTQNDEIQKIKDALKEAQNTAGYVIDFTSEDKGEKGQSIVTKKGSEGIQLIFNSYKNKQLTTNELCHAILQADILNYEVTSSWTPILDKEGKPTGEYARETKNVNLTTYLPIAIKVISSSDEKRPSVATAAVPDTLVFDMNGSKADYYKNKFQLFNNDHQEISDIVWEGIVQDPAAKAYYPTLSQNRDDFNIYILNPPVMYFKETSGLGKGYSIIAKKKDVDNYALKDVYWIQPIVITQNRYGSGMLNNWDGSLTIDEDNGTIMSTMIGAGVKNSDNSFSGVLMGEVKSSAGINSDLGIYGFDKGTQSFGFKVDGTAFLGAAGKGRIYFDGNTGIIKSGNYNKSSNLGMILNLNTGLNNKGEGSSFAMYGHREGQTDGGYQGVEIDTTSGTVFKLFVQDETSKAAPTDKKSILEVGSEQYVLQTANYSELDKKGLRIDLHGGELNGYDFTLNATHATFLENNKTKEEILTINSNAPIYPFNVNNKLQIAWDGTFNVNNKLKIFPDGAIAINKELEENKNYTIKNNTTEFVTDKNVPNFYVTADGVLHAEKGYFGGDIAMGGNIELEGTFYIKGLGYQTEQIGNSFKWKYVKNEKGEFVGPLDDQIIGTIGYATGFAQNEERNEDGSYVQTPTYGIALSNADFSKYLLATNGGIRMNSNYSAFLMSDKGASFTFKDEKSEKLQLMYTQDLTQMEESFLVHINDYPILHSGNCMKYMRNIIAVFA